VMSIGSSKQVKSPLHFARFEFKYLLPESRRRDIESHLRYFLEYDPFVKNIDDHKYIVRSLYFDDPAYSAFHDKIDGLHTRSKFRIRTYSSKIEDPAPYFLEIKGRHNNLVFKHRSNLASGVWEEYSGDRLTNAIVKMNDGSDVFNQFVYGKFRRRLQPVALINYRRRPYISKYDPTFRVTFDEGLTAFDAKEIYPDLRFQEKMILPGFTVMEVKFEHHMPSWFHRVIQAHQLKRVSISKICAGMEVLGLAADEN
jgi:hypothetical protein